MVLLLAYGIGVYAKCGLGSMPNHLNKEQPMARKPSFSRLIRNAPIERGLTVAEAAAPT